MRLSMETKKEGSQGMPTLQEKIGRWGIRLAIMGLIVFVLIVWHPLGFQSPLANQTLWNSQWKCCIRVYGTVLSVYEFSTVRAVRWALNITLDNGQFTTYNVRCDLYKVGDRIGLIGEGDAKGNLNLGGFVSLVDTKGSPNCDTKIQFP